MPYLNLQISAGGPLMDVMVGVSGPRRDALEKAKQAIPSAVSIRALVDTGASCTCIDPGVLQQLNLPPTGVSQVHTPSTGGTAHNTCQYDVSLTLVHPELQMQLQSVAVVESDLALMGIQALIGRDVLKNCLMVYDGQAGKFTLAF